MNKRKDEEIEKSIIIIINILAVLCLIIILIPLLLLSHYNVPGNDDWWFGKRIYLSLINQEGFLGYCKAVFETVKEHWYTYECRWASTLFNALMPANINFKFAHFNAWLFLGSLIGSQIYFIKTIFHFRFKSFIWIFPCVIGILIMEILYAPFPRDSFYNWTASVTYTFAFCLALLYISFLHILMRKDLGNGKRIIISLLAFALSAIVAANNFIIMAPMFIIHSGVLLYLIMYMKSKEGIYNKRIQLISLGIPVILFVISCCVVLMAPGLKVQLENRLSGESLGFFAAILFSFRYSLYNIFIHWMNLKIIGLLLLFIPFIYKGISQSEFKFRFPGLISAVTFILFASMVSVDSYTRNGQMSTWGINIWYYSYYLFLLINEIYWLGWLFNKGLVRKIVSKMKGPQMVYIIVWSLIWIALIGSQIIFKDKENLSSYVAYGCVKSGSAAYYAKAWEERFALCEDSSITNIIFEEVPRAGYITMDDYGSMAYYFDKESIIVK